MLGFTLSEVSLLLLFCLLLVLGSRLVQLSEERDEAEGQLQRKQETIATLTEQIESQRALVERVRRQAGGDAADSFDDVFRDLVLAQKVRAERDDLQKEVAGLSERDAELARVEMVIRKLGGDSAVAPSDGVLALHSEWHRREQGVMAKNGKLLADLETKEKSVTAIVLAAGRGEEGEANEKRAVDEAVAALRERVALRTIAEQTVGSARPGELLSDLRHGLELLVEKRKKLTGEQKGLGKGASYPPCWRNPETGKPDYLFAVRLREAGLIVYDMIPPHRAAERPSLRIDQVRFGELLSSDAFRQATGDVFQQSEQADCRHFVKVFDETDSKATYKSQLQVVEGHFYKLLSTSAFEVAVE